MSTVEWDNHLMMHHRHQKDLPEVDHVRAWSDAVQDWSAEQNDDHTDGRETSSPDCECSECAVEDSKRWKTSVRSICNGTAEIEKER